MKSGFRIKEALGRTNETRTERERMRWREDGSGKER